MENQFVIENVKQIGCKVYDASNAITSVQFWDRHLP